MHIGLVREVHQIIDHQSVIAFNVDQFAVRRPIGIVIPVQIWKTGWIGQRGISHPNPNQSVALDNGVRLYTGRRVHPLLAGHAGAPSACVVVQSMVTTDHLIALESTHRQRQQTVPTRIRQHTGLPVEGSVHDHFLIANGAGQKLSAHFNVIGTSVPSVQRERRRGRRKI